MPKLTGPLLSLRASGSVAKNLTYSERKTGSLARWQKKQKDVLTSERVEWRARFLQAVAAWHALTENEKEVYNEEAERLTMTGYNLFLKKYLSAPPIVFFPAYYGVAIYGVSIYGYI